MNAPQITIPKPEIRGTAVVISGAEVQAYREELGRELTPEDIQELIRRHTPLEQS